MENSIEGIGSLSLTLVEGEVLMIEDTSIFFYWHRAYEEIKLYVQEKDQDLSFIIQVNDKVFTTGAILQYKKDRLKNRIRMSIKAPRHISVQRLKAIKKYPGK
jgi:hypothetical protein